MKTRQFSEDQIIKLLQDAKKGEKPVEELCRDLRCSTTSFYAWKKKYGDTSPDEACGLRQLERENERLLKLVGQQRLELEGTKEILAKKR
ncbi:MAG: transposase [Deinococcota bacterium]